MGVRARSEVSVTVTLIGLIHIISELVSFLKRSVANVCFVRPYFALLLVLSLRSRDSIVMYSQVHVYVFHVDQYSLHSYFITSIASFCLYCELFPIRSRLTFAIHDKMLLGCARGVERPLSSPA